VKHSCLRLHILRIMRKSDRWMTVREIIEAEKSNFVLSNTSRACRGLVSLEELERRPCRLYVGSVTVREYEYRLAHQR
jgi:hypothetical protein